MVISELLNGELHEKNVFLNISLLPEFWLWPSVLVGHCWLGDRKSIQPIKIDDEVVMWLSVCPEQSANDLHMVWLMPLPPIISCFIKIRMVYLSGACLPRLSWKRGH